MNKQDMMGQARLPNGADVLDITYNEDKGEGAVLASWVKSGSREWITWAFHNIEEQGLNGTVYGHYFFNKSNAFADYAERIETL